MAASVFFLFIVEKLCATSREKNLFIKSFRIRRWCPIKSWMKNIHRKKLASVSWTRSNRLQMFFKMDVLKIFANFTGKHLCWILFLIKLHALRPPERLQHRSFPVKFANFLRTAFSTEHLQRLFLENLLVFHKMTQGVYVKHGCKIYSYFLPVYIATSSYAKSL